MVNNMIEAAISVGFNIYLLMLLLFPYPIWFML